MTARTAALLDTAIGNVKAARERLRHDSGLLASDLSSVIGTLRELAWVIDSYTTTLVDAYTAQHCLGHDNHADPAVVVAHIVGQLDDVHRGFEMIDGRLADGHNHAARLHNT
jgi:hypothetical protein